METILLYFTIKYFGNWNKIYKALEEKERVVLKVLMELDKKIKKEGWKIITIIDNKYPKQLQKSENPPFILFLKGNEDLLNLSMLQTTGESLDSITKERIIKSIPEITKSKVLVTTGKTDVDKFITKISDNGQIIISSSGIDKTELKRNKDLIITEWPFGMEETKEQEEKSDRLVAAFSNELILFNSNTNGGIDNIIKKYLHLGKDIYCFPGNGSKNDGNSKLIKQGADKIIGVKYIPSLPIKSSIKKH